MEKTKNIPKIRFKGYKDEWEKISLSKQADFLKGYGYKKDDLKQFGNEIILYGKMYTDYKTAYASSDTFAEINSKSVLSKTGDVIVPASGETAEDISIASAILKNGIILGGDLNIIRPKNCLDSIFLAISISSGETKKKLTKMAEGATIAHLRNNNLKKVNLFAPSCEEQKQIGSLFKNLDEKLEIEREKHEKLENFKKAMLENVFPREGEKRPKIRFGGYNDDWELLKLGELGEISSAGVDKVIRPNEKEVYLLNYMDVYKNKQPSNNNIHEFMVSSAKEHQILSKNVLKGDIFFTPSSETSDDIGHSMCIYNNVENLVYSYHILRFRPYDNKLDIYFSNYFANIYPVRKQLIVNCQGAQRMTLKMEEFNNLIVTIPSINEQKLIGSFFKNLDEKIQVSEEKITKIENFKKAMMEAMFV